MAVVETVPLSGQRPYHDLGVELEMALGLEENLEEKLDDQFDMALPGIRGRRHGRQADNIAIAGSMAVHKAQSASNTLDWSVDVWVVDAWSMAYMTNSYLGT